MEVPTAKPEDKQVKPMVVDLDQRRSFAEYLISSDVKLVRAEFMWHLQRQGQALPRRQEAEGMTFPDKAEQQRPALVSHEEVWQWAEGKLPHVFVLSVSHCWEAREHPDPCGHQLGLVASFTSLHYAVYECQQWLFFDYLSVYQYERELAEQERSFRKALDNMHALYAHASTSTLRIEGLTPPEVLGKMQDEGKHLMVYHGPSKRVMSIPLTDLREPHKCGTDCPFLHLNRTPYLERGWCRIEVEWSSSRGKHARNVRIDGQGREKYAFKAPMPPDKFQEQVGSHLKFTHRSDCDAVLALQRRIFYERASTTEELVQTGLAEEEVVTLAQVLSEYTQVRRLRITLSEMAPAAAKALGEALAAHPTLQEVECPGPDWCCLQIRGGGRDPLAKALAKALRTNPKITKVDLSCNEITADGAQALGDALAQNNSVTSLDLRGNCIGNVGAKALGDALAQNNSVTSLDLAVNELGDEGAKALAAALEINSAVTEIDLRNNRIRDEGAKALEEALKKNSTVTSLDLSHNNLSKEREQAWRRRRMQELLAVKLDKKPKQCQDDALAEISPKPGFEALADALTQNATVKRVYLGWKGPSAVTKTFIKIGEEGAKALADALTQNTMVTDLNLGSNGIGDVGAKALADALAQNATVKLVNLSSNQIGDEGAKADPWRRIGKYRRLAGVGRRPGAERHGETREVEQQPNW
ncbi:unnamed protein product [Effrenium voratum]|uniref:Protein NLRC3 n=1 Tax=Effrenium voratum TaxID=2562239 RepID=A0AA36N0I8_9DINO|nr:unnamed protein product [Effrenium voratum]